MWNQIALAASPVPPALLRLRATDEISWASPGKVARNPSAIERPRSVRDGFDQVLLESQPVDANVLRPYLHVVYFGNVGAQTREIFDYGIGRYRPTDSCRVCRPKFVAVTRPCQAPRAQENQAPGPQEIEDHPRHFETRSGAFARRNLQPVHKQPVRESPERRSGQGDGWEPHLRRHPGHPLK